MNYSEEEKEAIDKLEFFKETGYATFMIKYDVDRTTANGMIKRTIEIILNLIQKQDKIIDKMAEDIEEHMSEEVYNFLYICDKCKSNNEECHGDYCTETIKEYFKKVVDEDVKDKRAE